MSLFQGYTIFVTIAFLVYIAYSASKEVIAVKRSLVKPEEGETFDVGSAANEESVVVNEIASGGFRVGTEQKSIPVQTKDATVSQAPEAQAQQTSDEAIGELAEGTDEVREYQDYSLSMDEDDLYNAMRSMNADTRIEVRREELQNGSHVNYELPDRV